MSSTPNDTPRRELVALAELLGAGSQLLVGRYRVDVAWVLALLIGGLIAAPIAAWLVRLVPPRILGSLVGGVIVLTNSRTLLNSDWIAASDAVKIPVYVVIWLGWAAAVAWSVRAHRTAEALEPAPEKAQEPEADSVSA